MKSLWILCAGCSALLLGGALHGATLEATTIQPPTERYPDAEGVVKPLALTDISGYHFCIDRQPRTSPTQCGQGTHILVYEDVTADPARTDFVVSFTMPAGAPKVVVGDTFYVSAKTQDVDGRVSSEWSNEVAKVVTAVPDAPPVPATPPAPPTAPVLSTTVRLTFTITVECDAPEGMRCVAE